MSNPLRVMIWNEYRHEKLHEEVRSVYPNGLHEPIEVALQEAGCRVRIATVDEPEHGLTVHALNDTDVLLWWGHMAHEEVEDSIVERVFDRVLKGMGVVFLHSAQHSKLFKKLMGTSCNLNWREVGEKERVWVVKPSHPIAAGLGPYFELPEEEMYGEYFDVPEPDELVLVSWFEGGEVFRSGCCYNRGQGKLFYFRPGHETFPTYYDPNVLLVICNAVRWCTPVDRTPPPTGNVEPLEKLARLSKK